MLRALVSGVFVLPLAATGLLAADRPQSPTLVRVEVADSEEGGCRAALVRYARQYPYERRTNRTYRLPDQRRQLVSALRKPGETYSIASVSGEAGVPIACSGQALDAARLAGIREIAFWLPPQTSQPGESVERVSACEVAADPTRFRSRRIQMRGFVKESMNPDNIVYSLWDPGCRGHLLLTSMDTGMSEPFRGHALRNPVIAMTVTGTPGASACYFTPPGSSCGTYFRVEKVEDVERTDLCWEHRPIDTQRSEVIAQPCRRDP